MSTSSMAQPLPVVSVAPPPSTEVAGVCIREAIVSDAAAIYALVTEHLAEGHLLPRSLDEIGAHAHRFLVAAQDSRVIGCGELAPLSVDLAEVRSLVVSREARSLGLGTEIVDRLVQRAADSLFQRVCAFTHRPSSFVRLGFSIVPHVWLPEKIVTDCHRCPRFRHCGQYAVVLALGQRRRLHG